MGIGALVLKGFSNRKRLSPKLKPKRLQKSSRPQGFFTSIGLPREARAQLRPLAPGPTHALVPVQAQVLTAPPAIVAPTLEVFPAAAIQKGPAEAYGSHFTGLQTGDLLGGGKAGLKENIEAFLLDQRSEHTRRAYEKDLKRFVKFLHLRALDRTREEALTRSVVIAYKEFLLSEKLQHTTIDRHLATLRSFFQWLVDDGVIEKNPAHGVRFLNPRKLSSTIGLSDEEVTRMLQEPDLHTRTGAQHYAILMLLFFCGLRRSELCSLRTRQIQMERGKPTVRLRGKGNAERVIAIPPAAWNALRYSFYVARRKMTEDDWLFRPLKNPRGGDLQRALDPSSIFYLVRRYAKLAGIESRISPHSCRATAISNARDRHVPDRAIQEFAGWSSPDMITRYDKRKTSVENSASHAIQYGNADRVEKKVEAFERTETASTKTASHSEKMAADNASGR